MPQAVFKFTALAGIVTLGFWFVIQAQQQINHSAAGHRPQGGRAQQTETIPQLGEATADIENALADFDAPLMLEEDALLEQSEPLLGAGQPAAEEPPLFDEEHEEHAHNHAEPVVEEDQFQPVETPAAEPAPAGGLGFTAGDAPVMQAEFEEDEPALAETDADIDAEQPPDNEPRPLFDSPQAEPADSNATPESPFFDVEDDTDAAAETIESDTGQSTPPESTAEPAAAPEPEPDPFPAATEPAQPQDLEQMQPLFGDEPLAEPTGEPAEQFPPGEIDTGDTQDDPFAVDELPAVDTRTPAPEAEETLPAENPFAGEFDAETATTESSESPAEAPAPSPADEESGAQAESPPAEEETPVPAPAPQDEPDSSDAPQLLQSDSEASPLTAETDAATGTTTVTPPTEKPQTSAKPKIKIEKRAPENALLGKPMIYTILLENVSGQPAYEVRVEDQIPAGTELTGTIPQAELDKKTLIWKLGTLKPGTKKKILIRLIPHQAGQVGSVATVHFLSQVPRPAPAEPPQLALAFEGPPQAKIGDSVIYRFKVSNTGTRDAENVFLRNIVPDGLTHPAGNDLEYAVGRLPAGESKEIELTLTADRKGTALSRAVITADGNLRLEKQSALKVLGSSLIISRTGPKRQYVGRESEYVNLITNESAAPVTQATVKETVPDGMKFAAATAGGRFDPQTRTVAWQIDQLGPKQSRELKVTLIPTTAGEQTSLVEALDANGTKVSTSSETAVEGFALLKTEVVPPQQPVALGEKLTMRVVAHNRGTETAEAVRVIVQIPNGLEFLSARGPVRHKRAGDSLQFETLEKITAGQQAAFEIVFRAKQPGDARLRVEIDAGYLTRPLVRDEAVLVLP